MSNIGMREPLAGIEDEEEDESLWDEEYGYVWMRPDVEWVWEYYNGNVGDEKVYSDRDQANSDATSKWDHLTDSERREYADDGWFRVYARLNGNEVWVDMDCCETYWIVRMTNGAEGNIEGYVRDQGIAEARIEAEWNLLTAEERDRILRDGGWRFDILECLYHGDAHPAVVRDLLAEKRSQRASETQETRRIINTEMIHLVNDHGLSPREAQVYALTLHGYSQTAIARDLGYVLGIRMTVQSVHNALSKAKTKMSTGEL